MRRSFIRIRLLSHSGPFNEFIDTDNVKSVESVSLFEEEMKQFVSKMPPAFNDHGSAAHLVCAIPSSRELSYVCISEFLARKRHKVGSRGGAEGYKGAGRGFLICDIINSIDFYRSTWRFQLIKARDFTFLALSLPLLCEPLQLLLSSTLPLEHTTLRFLYLFAPSLYYWYFKILQIAPAPH